jgi:AcrR family transcriptional regulator
MSRAPQQRRVETRERLLAAARTLIAERGIAGLRTEDIVEHAGVAKGTFFSHFPDKEHLLAVLTAETLKAARERLRADTVVDVEQVVQALLPILTEMIAEPAILTALLRFGGPSTSGVGVYEELCAQQTHLHTMLATLQVLGRVRGDVDATVLGEGVQAFLFHAAAVAVCGAAGTEPQARGRALFTLLATKWLLPHA